MVDRLATIGTGVHDHPEPATVCCANTRSDGQEFGGKCGIGSGQRRDVVVVRARNDQHMDRRLRIDVVERDNPLRVMHEGRRDLAGGNLAEQTTHGVIVFRSGPPRRARQHDAGGHGTGSGRSQY